MLSMLLVPIVAASAVQAEDIAVERPYFGIHVVDAETGRGVPLMTLRTVNDIQYVSDSAGWVAVNEPDLAGLEVFFHVSGPGYEIDKDGFGFRGRRWKITPGEAVTLKVRCTNIAERLYRVTGQGIYRDSELMGLDVPAVLPRRGTGVVGQDSVQAVEYRDKIFWLWGDTNLARYPLGNFQVTAATSSLPGQNRFHPAAGVPLFYFTDIDRDDRIRKMMPLKEPGAVWLFGLINIDDADGQETLIAHYSRQKQLGKVLEHGLARYNDDTGKFERLLVLNAEEAWRHPRGNAFTVSDDGESYLYFAESFADVRVNAHWQSVTDPKQYESLAWDASTGEYRWQRDVPPTTQTEELQLIAAGKLPQDKSRYQIVNADNDRPVQLHRSSIAWNAFRQRWIMIATQFADGDLPSHLGECWYAEATHPSGPWHKAIKIASHPRYSFYNPRQHTFFAADDGRTIYFEGTYTRMFSGNPVATPRYDYNQLMYRLDLTDQRLNAVR